MQTFTEKSGNSETEFNKSGKSRVSKDSDAIWLSVSTPVSSFPVQRKAGCACGGGCPACQAKSSDLSISQPNDASEIEADRAADTVMRMTGKDSPAGQSQPASLSKTIAPVVQPKSEAAAASVSNELSNKINSSQGGGSNMDGGTRSFMQSRFGADFSRVKIHTDGEAAQMNRELKAKAFTVGNDIYFNEGEYKPDSESGKRLLAHELTHTIQQHKQIIRRQPAGGAAVDAGVADDAETKLGKEILANAPNGLKLGFYDHSEPEMVNKSGDWAVAENAIGFRGTKTAITAGDLIFGKAISDANNATTAINDISALAKTSVTKAAAATGVTVDEQYKVKAVAFFAHGTSGWCSITPISGNAGKKLVKDVAANLKSDVDIIIYACSVAGSGDDNWYEGTLDTGGKDSMAAGVRDQLYDSNIRKGKVWGHTTVGHVTSNFALRYFSSASRDMAGQSYVSEYVFTPYDEYLIREEVLKQLDADGYDRTTLDTSKLSEYQFKNLRNHFYKCYAEANKQKTYNGRNLAEAAPNHPSEVAQVINDYWNDTYWNKIKTNYMKGIIKHFKLVKK